MKNKVFVATLMVEWNVVEPLLHNKYGKKVEIELARVNGLEELKTFINQNKYSYPVFIVEGEHGSEIETKLKESGLEFGMFEKDPVNKKNWFIRIYNAPASKKVSILAGR